jgi:REP element-mobilizing transposase RayT
LTASNPLFPDRFYHIYNRGNNRDNIFHEERNYEYFLKLYAKYILPIADTYAYCLLKNHFHLFDRIKADVSGFQNLTRLPDKADLSKTFSNFVNVYAKAFNKTYRCTGKLLQSPFGRVWVTNGSYHIHLITYIHQNPQKHGFVTNFREWPYSSYHDLVSRRISLLQKKRVFELFHGQDQLEEMHRMTNASQELIALAPSDFD